MNAPRDLPRKNRTGLTANPSHARPAVEGVRVARPSSAGDAQEIASVRISYAAGSEPIGQPLAAAADPGSVELEPDRLEVLVDKASERLAFERGGVRLYEALMSKLDAYGGFDGGPERSDLEEIREEELEHAQLVQRLLESLGADPTAISPSANVQAVAGSGLCKVLTDPRTNLQQCLEAILVAELVDNDCWDTLLALVREIGEDDLAGEFEAARSEEREHLARVREWVAAGLGVEGEEGAIVEPMGESAARGQSSSRGRSAPRSAGGDGAADGSRGVSAAGAKSRSRARSAKSGPKKGAGGGSRKKSK